MNIKDNWQSLSGRKTPDWYYKGKFGIFIHWGIYSVPGYGNEWYSRNMYVPGSVEYEHHLNTYGNHKDFGYKDFIPLFKAEKFKAEEWIEIFRNLWYPFLSITTDLPCTIRSSTAGMPVIWVPAGMLPENSKPSAKSRV